MSLLSAAEKAEIRADIKLVTDTFYVTPVTWRQYTQSMARYNEDRDESRWTEHSLLCLAEYPTEKVKQSLAGGFDGADVKVTFNMQDLQTAGHINADDLVKFSETKDEFVVNGELFKVSAISYDGPLDKLNVLCVITGEKKEVSSINGG